MSTPNIVPRADGEGSIGVPGKKWGNVETTVLVVGEHTFEEIDADEVPYDNTESGLTAENVQAAIDEVLGKCLTIDGGTF